MSKEEENYEPKNDSISGAIAHNIRKYPSGSAITMIFLAWAAASVFDSDTQSMNCAITDHDPTSAITSIECDPQ